MVDGQTGVTRAPEHLRDVVGRLRVLHGGHAHARDHDVAYVRILELDGVFDEPALVRVKLALALRRLYYCYQILFGYAFTLAQLERRGQKILPAHEKRRHGREQYPRHARERLQRACRALGIVAHERPRQHLAHEQYEQRSHRRRHKTRERYARHHGYHERDKKHGKNDIRKRGSHYHRIYRAFALFQQRDRLVGVLDVLLGVPAQTRLAREGVRLGRGREQSRQQKQQHYGQYQPQNVEVCPARNVLRGACFT